MDKGIVKCAKCNRNYIEEEYDLHLCKRLAIEMFDTEGNRWGSYDKLRFFPLPPFRKLSDDSIQSGDTKTTDDKYTEPSNIKVK